MIGSAPALGVATPKEATLFIIATFVSAWIALQRMLEFGLPPKPGSADIHNRCHRWSNQKA